MAIGSESSRLVGMCVEAATESGAAVELWRRQRRSMERLPSHLADTLLHRLLHRRLLFPSLLEVFKNSVEEIDFRGQSYVDAEWIVYLGAFHYLRSLNLADCHKINNSAIWPISGLIYLKEVDLSRCAKISDAGIRHLLSIPLLEKLSISETGVTAEGVRSLASLTNLSILDLGGLPVNDSVLSSLQVLKKLQHLDLWGSEVSNKGAALLKTFPVLSFLNLAWTKVTEVPNVHSLEYLNMSNCTIHSILNGEGDKAPLTELILSGAALTDSSEAFLYVETSHLSQLDLSNSSLQSLSFLPCMKTITYLNLGDISVGDDSVEHIACIGSTLRYLNLCKTRITSAGLEILAGHVPNLETLMLSCTPIDDAAIPYISMMPSLRVINLNRTELRGSVQQQVGEEFSLFPSLTPLGCLSHLERLDLEETRITDAALSPLSSFHRLNYLSLRSVFLTDTSLYEVSSIQSLTNLSICDAVLTNAGLECFNPPPVLKVLDLSGCWLLTQNVLLSFSAKHPQLELRHTLLSITPPEKEAFRYSSPSRASSRSSPLKRQDGELLRSPVCYKNNNFLDQRLKYSREELLALQFSTASLTPSCNEDTKKIE